MSACCSLKLTYTEISVVTGKRFNLVKEGFRTMWSVLKTIHQLTQTWLDQVTGA